MQLKHGWTATIDHEEERIFLEKQVKGGVRTINLKYVTGGGMPPRLKTIDHQGNFMQDYTNALPPTTRAQLIAFCKDKWGE